MLRGPIVLEIFLGFCVPIAWAAWELIQLRRERKKDAAKPADPAQRTSTRMADPRAGIRH